MRKLDPDLQPHRIREFASKAAVASLPDLLSEIDDDDCLAFDPASHVVVATTDFINSRPISRTYGIGTSADLGWLSVANNVSDLLGSGATPIAYLSAIVMPRGSGEHEFDEIIDGVLQGCNDFAIKLGAGDTKLGDCLVIGGTALGTLRSADRVLQRRNAVPGHDVFVTGPVGGLAAGITLLDLDEKVPAQRRDQISRAILRPAMPIDLVKSISELGLCSAGTDISDGLIGDLYTITRSSGCGIAIDADRVPRHPLVDAAASRSGINPFGLACAIGGDLQMAYTAPSQQRHALENLGLVRIGEVTAGSEIEIRRADGSDYELGFVGHRDSRGLTFIDEVAQLARQISGRPD